MIISCCGVDTDSDFYVQLLSVVCQCIVGPIPCSYCSFMQCAMCDSASFVILDAKVQQKSESVEDAYDRAMSII